MRRLLWNLGGVAAAVGGSAFAYPAVADAWWPARMAVGVTFGALAGLAWCTLVPYPWRRP